MVPNKRFLVAIDLDGTLLKTLSRGIHPLNKQVIQELIKLGHIVVIATGRPICGCHTIYQWMNLIHPIICNSGATIFRLENNKLVNHRIEYIRENAIQQVLKIDLVRDSMVSIMVQSDEGFFLSKINHHLLQFTLVEKFFNFVECPITQMPLNKTFSLSILFQKTTNTNIIIEKIHEIDNHYFHAFEVRVGKIFDIHNKSNNFRLVDITVALYSKSQAVQYLQKEFSILKKNVIYIGDSDNDISALCYFSTCGVAMKNASMIVKKNARYITDLDNDVGGVGDFLGKKFNLQLEDKKQAK